jgi:hypothetical protein
LENRAMIRPLGVVSKNDKGQRKILNIIRLCSLFDAVSVPMKTISDATNMHTTAKEFVLVLV